MNDSLRIAVTGGSGKLGRGVIAVLAAAGHEVVNLDRAPAPGGPARVAGFVEVDLTDYGQVADALSGVDEVYDRLDAVVHLAAIPAPGLLTNVATFHNNMLASYNVFEACRKAGIRRIVHASSETVLGLPFDVPPPYVPVDEEYPARAEFDLLVGQAPRRDDGGAVVPLGSRAQHHRPAILERDGRRASTRASRRSMRIRCCASGTSGSYVDVRDAGQAVQKALETRGPGYETFIIANADTVMSRSSASLVAEVFPGVPVTHQLGEHETLLSIDKARRVLGYEPRFGWRTGLSPFQPAS